MPPRNNCLPARQLLWGLALAGYMQGAIVSAADSVLVKSPVCERAVGTQFELHGVVGDYLCAKYGELSREPITITIANNRMTEARSENTELERDFWSYCHTDENSDRVGEFAIGTNIQLTRVIGQILQDEKIPGVHIAFGHPYAEHTGADWLSSTHIDVVGTRFDIWIDDQKIMEDGRFLI